MGTGTESYGRFGDGRTSKLSSDCFWFSVGSSSRCQEVEGLYTVGREKRRFKIVILENGRVNYLGLIVLTL